MLLDSTHPKLDWEDEYGALRGNLNAFFNMAIAIVIAIVLCVAGYLVFKFTMIPSYAVYNNGSYTRYPAQYYYAQECVEYRH